MAAAAEEQEDGRECGVVVVMGWYGQIKIISVVLVQQISVFYIECVLYSRHVNRLPCVPSVVTASFNPV